MSKTSELYDVQAEELFLQHIIANPASAEQYTDVASLNLSAERQELGKQILSLLLKQDTPSDDSLRINGATQRCRDLFSKLEKSGLPTVTLPTLSGRLRDITSRRFMAQNASEVFSLASEGKTPASDIIEKVEIMAFEARGLSTGKASSTGSKGMDYMAELLDDLRWRCNNPIQIKGYKFGFSKIERLIDGLQGGRLYVLGARPSVGKTAFMGNILMNLAEQGISSLTFSLEMPDLELRQRFLTAVCGVNPKKSINGALTKGDLVALKDGINKMQKMNIRINDTNRISIEELKSVARREVAKHDIKVIAIDYVQLLRGVEPKSRTSTVEEISECTGKLKALAKELNIPIIVLAQLKRSGNSFVNSRTEETKPTLESLKGSGSLEQDADVVWLLHRDPSVNASEADLLMPKNRDGSTGEALLSFANDITTFKEIINPKRIHG